MGRPSYMRPPRPEMDQDQRLAARAAHAANLPSPYALGHGASFWQARGDNEDWVSVDGRWRLVRSRLGVWTAEAQ